VAVAAQVVAELSEPGAETDRQVVTVGRHLLLTNPEQQAVAAAVDARCGKLTQNSRPSLARGRTRSSMSSRRPRVLQQETQLSQTDPRDALSAVTD